LAALMLNPARPAPSGSPGPGRSAAPVRLAPQARGVVASLLKAHPVAPSATTSRTTGTRNNRRNRNAAPFFLPYVVTRRHGADRLPVYGNHGGRGSGKSAAWGRSGLGSLGRVPSAGGMVAAVVAVTAWGIGPVLVKYIDLSGGEVSFHRLWLGAVVAATALYATGGRLTRDLLRVSAPGGIAFGTNVVLFFVAVKRTSVANATVIAALQPALLLLVASRRFGERVRLADVWWTAAAIGGVVLVMEGSAGANSGDAFGDVLAVGALLLWAWYFVASKQAREVYGALQYQAGMAVVAAVVACPLAALAADRVSMPSGDSWGWLVFLVLVPGGGHLLMNYAHAHVPLTVTSILRAARGHPGPRHGRRPRGPRHRRPPPFPGRGARSRRARDRPALAD